jgi:hypothetical protein
MPYIVYAGSCKEIGKPSQHPSSKPNVNDLKQILIFHKFFGWLPKNA